MSSDLTVDGPEDVIRELAADLQVQGLGKHVSTVRSSSAEGETLHLTIQIVDLTLHAEKKMPKR
jgi:hypothetical protein